MDSIGKSTVHLLALALKAYGVSRVVVSPGSRCAPVTAIFERSGFFELTPVIDERCAAFVGLGMALATGQPVAIVCTSGTAPLNYGPALAEAFYRRVPLIAITADRPASLVDQRDSQTIRQAEALGAVVRGCIDISDDSSPRYLHTVSRKLNGILTEVTGRIPGPVQINMQLDAPLTPSAPAPDIHFRKISTWRSPDTILPEGLMESIPTSSRVLVVAGDLAPAPALQQALEELQSASKAFIFAEVQSNLHGFTADFPNDTDFSQFPQPDIVISLGGSLVSGRMKAFLRRCKSVRHISLGYDDCLVDTFFRLSDVVEVNPASFFKALALRLSPNEEFCDSWNIKSSEKETWEVPAALSRIISAFSDADFHFSNGSSARYAQLLSFPTTARIECNRGVSGIDGATSTAMGYAAATTRRTVFFTGDMSAAYDSGALALGIVPDSFRMVVLDNHGGDIFRAVATTKSLPECEKFFVLPPRFPIRELSAAYGFAFFDNDIDNFINHTGSPAILRLEIAPGDANKLF